MSFTQREQSSSPRLLLKLAMYACVFTCVLYINNPGVEKFCWLQAKPCFCSHGITEIHLLWTVIPREGKEK